MTIETAEQVERSKADKIREEIDALLPRLERERVSISVIGQKSGLTRVRGRVKLRAPQRGEDGLFETA